jgi:rhodanese-related sulfurtransferase
MQFVLNNWHLFLALFVIVLALVFPTLVQRTQGIENLSPAQAVLMMNRQSGVIVDISEPKDYNAAHIPSSINVPLSKLSEPGGLLQKYKDRPLIVAARSGAPLKGAMILRRRGWKTVHLLAGGVLEWQKQGLPLEK